MRHAFLFTLNLIIFCGSLFSQNCPTSFTLFSTQTQIDNFPTNYPGCTEFFNARIQSVESGDVITNLDGFSQLTSIVALTIIDNSALTNLNGLQNITGSVSLLFIEDNNVLESLSGLEGITSVTNPMKIEGNHALNNLEGLNNLVSVGDLSIINNDQLSDLDGINSLSNVGDLNIWNNQNLVDFNGLENLETVSNILIRGNASLTSLMGLEGVNNTNRVAILENDALTSLTGLDNLVGIDGNLLLEDNDALTNISALSNLNSVRDITIESNSLLTNLQGLEQVGTHPFGVNLSIISNATLVDMSALGNAILKEVNIRNNPELLTLNGLEGAVNLDYLLISFNSKLTDLTGLENLISIEETLILQDNNSLADISALSNLSSLESLIIDNSNLVNLTGLDNISTLNNQGFFSTNFVSIVNNPALSDISALDILPYYTDIDKLNIYNNPNLSMCSEEGICYYLASGRWYDIYGNLTGCNSYQEILNTCTITDYPCPMGDVTFASQAQVDSFIINYPNCVRIFGNLTITSNSITNLDALSRLQVVDGDLNICNNPLLISISGLSRIHIGGDFWLKNNDALAFVSAYFNSFGGSVYIEDNDVLESIESLTSNMPGMNFLRIINNPNLFSCTIVWLGGGGGGDICTYLEQGGPSEISNNADGCNSADQIIAYCTTAPITLTYFQAKIHDKTTLLTWETATETNNAGFEIQRSTDGINWNRIAWEDGQGTSTSIHNYTYRDENPLFGTIYYRLKQLDFDGTYEYSDIVQVNYKKGNISIYPNPVKNTLHISNITDEDIQDISIYSQTGREIRLQHTSDIIDVSTLSPGMYIVKIGVKEGLFYEKFIVQ